jgi:membrane peptidoglycan carboxypeptidase
VSEARNDERRAAGQLHVPWDAMNRLMHSRGPRARGDRGAIGHFALFLGVSLLSGVLVAGLALPLVGGVGLAARETADHYESLPDELSIQALPQASRMLDAEGRTLASFYYQNRVTVPLQDIAPLMREAIVAIEDSRFYEHRGIDLRGTARAFVNNSSGDDIQGGSTITQQLVKNILVESAAARDDAQAAKAAKEKSYDRKLRELRYAIGLEKQLTKDQILDRYLNISYFGSSAYGVQAAAKRYFSTTAQKLTLAQAATLAGLVQSPGAFDPLRHPEAAANRRNVVLQRMADLGYVTQAEADQAAQSPLGLKESPVPNGCSSSSAPFFCDFVVESLKNDKAFAETPEERTALLLRGGLTITTTLDPRMQKYAQRAVDKNIPRKDKSGVATAISMVQPGTGKIKAMAQNRTWGTDRKRGMTAINYNVDTKYGGSTFGFQAGSTFKVFTAAAALEQGMPMSLRINAPPTKEFDNFRNCETGAKYKPYRVSNSTRSSSTMVDMPHGLAHSINTWAVGLEERTGLCAPAEMAEKLGVHSAGGEKLERVPSFTLGVAGVAPLSMAEAYATFAARGEHCESYAITGIADRDGRAVPHSESKCKQVMDKPIADAMNSMLAGVIDGPIQGRTGQAMSLGRPAGGKTGTTQQNYDVWFIGYTPDLATAVWVGDPGRVVDGRIKRKAMRGITINGKTVNAAFGGTIAGPIWKYAMSRSLQGTPEHDFVRPDRSMLRGEDVKVPQTRGQTTSEALRTLRGEGLAGAVADSRVESWSVDQGRVVFSDPREGSTVKVGDEVRVYISNGRRPSS